MICIRIRVGDERRGRWRPRSAVLAQLGWRLLQHRAHLKRDTISGVRHGAARDDARDDARARWRLVLQIRQLIHVIPLAVVRPPSLEQIDERVRLQLRELGDGLGHGGRARHAMPVHGMDLDEDLVGTSVFKSSLVVPPRCRERRLRPAATPGQQLARHHREQAPLALFCSVPRVALLTLRR